MKSHDTKVSRFKIYKKGKEYCAETVGGKWRILVISRNTISVSESDKKPEQFKESVLMTEQEMIDNEIDLLYSDYYYPKYILEGAKTLSEAAQMLRDEANYLEVLEKKGWQFTSPVNAGVGHMECQLKPFDFINSLE